MDTNPGRKSLQAATEYLIIYCAAILIIAIVMVSLYTIFVAPQSKVPNSCIFSGGFTCGDLLLITNSISTNTVMTLFLTNAGDVPILSPTIWASIAGVNTPSSKCLPNYVKAGGSILCSLNLTAKSASTRLISGKVYISEQNCAFSASATCQNAANQIFVGSFVGTAQQNGASPGIQISAATGPVLTLSYFSVSSQPPQYIAFSPLSPIAYVVTPAISNVVVVNTGTSMATANISLSPSSTSAYFNAQGTLAYVLNYANSNIVAINPANGAVLNSISIPNPLSVAFNPSGTLAYVTSQSGTVSAINTANSAVIKTLTVGSYPSFVAFSPIASLAYVVNYASGTVSAINTANSAIISNIPVGSYPQLLAFNPSGTAAYVPNSGGSTVSIINTANSAVTNVNVGPNPYAVTFNPSGTLAYVDNSGGNTLSVINTATLSVNTITLDSRTDIAPGTMVISSSGSFLYISNSYGNTISLVDTATNAVGTIALGLNPSGVFFNPQGTLAYVTKGATNVITVVDLTKYPSTGQKYGLLVTLTIAGGPFKGATINFSTPNSYFGINPKYAVTNASGQALTYITTSLPGSTGTVYANLTNAISANVQVTFR